MDQPSVQVSKYGIAKPHIQRDRYTKRWYARQQFAGQRCFGIGMTPTEALSDMSIRNTVNDARERVRLVRVQAK